MKLPSKIRDSSSSEESSDEDLDRESEAEIKKKISFKIVDMKNGPKIVAKSVCAPLFE